MIVLSWTGSSGETYGEIVNERGSSRFFVGSDEFLTDRVHHPSMKTEMVERFVRVWRWFVGLFRQKRRTKLSSRTIMPEGYGFIGMPGFATRDENGNVRVIEPQSANFKLVKLKSSESQPHQNSPHNPETTS